MRNSGPISLSESRGGRLLTGTAGWSYPDWQGFFYPATTPAGFSRLAYLARFVDVAEVNTSFYRIPHHRLTSRWLADVVCRPDFVFTAKLWQGFTHDDAPPDAGAAAAFAEAFAPLREAGRLAALLAQFPWSFKWGQAGLDRLARLADLFPSTPLVVETRHSSWLRDEYFAFLRERGLAFCNIDQPVIGASIGPTAEFTAPPAYVRLHGRRYDTWFARDAPPAERYNYLYRTEELAEWVERIKALMPKSERTLAIANNHFNAKAVAAALETKALATQRPQPAPSELLTAFPHLADRCRVAPADTGDGAQLELF